MDDNKKTNPEEQESTIFSDPAEHNDKTENFKKKRIIAVICSVLGLAVLVGVIFAVIKLIPDKSTDTEVNKEVTIARCDTASIESIGYKAGDDEFEIIRTVNEKPSAENDKYIWYIKDIEEYKQETSATYNLVSTVSSLKGINQEEASDEVYGFDNPSYVIDVKSSEAKYTLIIGDEAGTGRYLKVIGDFPGTFIINKDTVSAICREKIRFANHLSYDMVKFNSDVSAYRNSGGALEKFDSLTVKGKNYETPIVFGMNTDPLSNTEHPYSMVSPYSMVADNVETVMALYTNTLAVDGGYSFYDDAEIIKQYGLDDPDIEVVLKVGSEEKWFKFSYVDDTYMAAVSDDVHMVKKVKIDALTLEPLTLKSYTCSSIVPYNLGAFSAISVKGEEADATFEITASGSETKVTSGGNELKGFADFYSYLQSLKPVYGEVDVNENEADLTVMFTLTDSRELKLVFSKDGSKYNFSYGKNTGQISSANYKKLIKKLKDSL